MIRRLGKEAKSFLKEFWRHKLAVVLFSMTCALFLAIYTFLSSPTYKANAVIGSLTWQTGGDITMMDKVTALRSLRNLDKYFTNLPTAQKASEILDPGGNAGLSPKQANQRVKVSRISGSSMWRISASGKSPQAAAALANTWSEIMLAEIMDQIQRKQMEAIGKTEMEAANMSRRYQSSLKEMDDKIKAFIDKHSSKKESGLAGHGDTPKAIPPFVTFLFSSGAFSPKTLSHFSLLINTASNLRDQNFISDLVELEDLALQAKTRSEVRQELLLKAEKDRARINTATPPFRLLMKAYPPSRQGLLNRTIAGGYRGFLLGVLISGLWFAIRRFRHSSPDTDSEEG